MRRKTASAMITVAMLATAPHARAQTRAGGEFRVNNFTVYDQLASSVARDRRSGPGSPYGPYRVKPNVPLMKTPIWSRVTGWVGQ